MKRSSLDLVNIGHVSTLQDVLAAFEELDTELVESGLTQFKLFNQAYLVVTRTIQRAAKDGYFKDPKFIESFIVHFASYYFEAVNQSNRRQTDLSPSWAALSDYASLESPPIFTSLLLGANAHINYDLPQVLSDLVPADRAEEALADLIKIDSLLMRSGKEIIGLFEEENKLYDFVRRRLRFAYYRPVMYTVLYWRLKAWGNYKKVSAGQATLPDISGRSAKIANRLLMVSRILG